MTRGLLPGHPAAPALVDWVNDRDRPRLPWPLRARLAWGAFWFERLLRAQATQSVPSLPPAFVMGFWRSGTTLLHNLLYAHYDCTAPLTWQCHAPASFLLQPPPPHDISARRPMDDGIVHLLGPQEDEFALMLLGEPSLYRGFLDPVRLGELADMYLADDSPALPRWQAFVTRLSSGTVPLLLKSPNHVFRLGTISRVWPEARMVWICRPFAEVLASNLRMWRAMTDLHRLRTGEADLPAFLERVAQHYRDTLVALIGTSHREMLWLDYADLVADPDTVAVTAARFLQLAPRTAPLADVDIHVHPGRTTSLALPTGRLDALAEDIDRLHATAKARWSTI